MRGGGRQTVTNKPQPNFLSTSVYILVNGGHNSGQLENTRQCEAKNMIDLQNCENSLSDALKENNLAQSIALPSSLITDKTSDNAIDFDEKPIVANTKTFEHW